MRQFKDERPVTYLTIHPIPNCGQMFQEHQNVFRHNSSIADFHVHRRVCRRIRYLKSRIGARLALGFVLQKLLHSLQRHQVLVLAAPAGQPARIVVFEIFKERNTGLSDVESELLRDLLRHFHRFGEDINK